MKAPRLVLSVLSCAAIVSLPTPTTAQTLGEVVMRDINVHMWTPELGRERTCEDVDLNAVELEICTKVRTLVGVESHIQLIAADGTPIATTAEEECRKYEGTKTRCLGNHNSKVYTKDGREYGGHVWCERSDATRDNTCEIDLQRDIVVTVLWALEGDQTTGVIHSSPLSPRYNDHLYRHDTYRDGLLVPKCSEKGGNSGDSRGLAGNIVKDDYCVFTVKGFWGAGATYRYA